MVFVLKTFLAHECENVLNLTLTVD